LTCCAIASSKPRDAVTANFAGEADPITGNADGPNFIRPLQAVRAGLSLPWSTGPVEGQISRLKTIKRSMCGRAGFDLLRHRVLEAA
jgi:hypothetical protein